MSVTEIRTIIGADDPFAPLPNERNIPLDTSRGQRFEFTRRWFKSRNQKTWSTFLPERFPPDQPWNMIQIGVFEGMDLVWCLQHLLNHPLSRVVAIDPWLPTTKLDAQYMEGVHARAMRNLTPWYKKIDVRRTTSERALKQLLDGPQRIRGKVIAPGEWDLIVVDGDHNAPAVYMDAACSLKLARPGGWIVFDDVRNRIPKRDHVLEGLQEFTSDYGPDEVRCIWKHRYCDCYEVLTNQSQPLNEDPIG